MKERAREPAILLLMVLVMASVLSTCGNATPTEEAAAVDERFLQGNEYAQAGDFESAITEYQAVLEADAENVSALTNLGVAYYSTGQLDLAVEQYETAIGIRPEDADIHSNLGAAYVQLGQFDKALDEYQRAVELKPDLPEAFFGLGVVHLQLGQVEDAIEAFERFQEHDTGKDTIATEQAAQYLQQLKGQ